MVPNNMAFDLDLFSFRFLCNILFQLNALFYINLSIIDNYCSISKSILKLCYLLLLNINKLQLELKAFSNVFLNKFPQNNLPQ